MSKNAYQVKRMPRLGWAIVIVLLIIVWAIYAGWQAALRRLDAEALRLHDAEAAKISAAIDDRLQDYTATLHGFRGLFSASRAVNDAEYQTYFSSLNLQQSLPGFNTINFISRVQAPEVTAFVKRIQNDKSLRPEGLPNFTISPAGNRLEYFVLTYAGVADITAPQGTDLLTNEERRPSMEVARDTGRPVATGSVNLLGSDGKPTERRGFLIILPLYYTVDVPSNLDARRAAHVGFIQAIFDYEVLLKETLRRVPHNVAISIFNQSDTANTAVYSQGTAVQDGHQSRHTIAVAGNELVVTVTTDKQFGLSPSELGLPRFVVFVGGILVVLLVLLLWLLLRSRHQAYRLANMMTLDLQAERAAAIAAKNKDEAILSSIGDAVFALDKAGNIILFNKAAERLSGYTTKEALGKPYRQVLRFVAADTLRQRDHFIVTAQAGKFASMPGGTLLVQKNGQHVPVADSAAPIYNAEGQQEGSIVVFRDVTTELKFQRMLQESNERFELAAKATSDAVYDLDLNTGALTWNSALSATYGYSPHEKTNSLEWWVQHINPDDALRLTHTIDQLNDKKINNWTVDYRFRRADGSYAFVRDRAFVLRDSQGQAVRLIGSMLDMSKQRQLDQAKDEFVSLISHQLRTPLTAIRLFSEMLYNGQSGKLNATQKEYIHTVHESTKRMIRLVADILNISRVELGRVKIDPQPTDVLALISSCIDEAQPLANEKNIKLSWKPPKHLPLLNVDPSIFSQVVHNLLTNAIRYSPQGSGRVIITFGQQEGEYVFTVSDNGIGIPKQAQLHIFEHFYRADNARRVEGEGTGLGLYLVKMIMQTAGGKVWFKSSEGEGATFYVSLPLSGMKGQQGMTLLT